MGKSISETEPYSKKPSTGNVVISKRAEARESHFRANQFGN